MTKPRQRPQVIYRPGVDDPEGAPPTVLEHDPHYPATAGINRYRVQMSYNDAMRLKDAGELERPTLTENGWICP